MVDRRCALTTRRRPAHPDAPASWSARRPTQLLAGSGAGLGLVSQERGPGECRVVRRPRRDGGLDLHADQDLPGVGRRSRPVALRASRTSRRSPRGGASSSPVHWSARSSERRFAERQVRPSAKFAGRWGPSSPVGTRSRADRPASASTPSPRRCSGAGGRPGT
jgi:hypothetical protein